MNKTYVGKLSTKYYLYAGDAGVLQIDNNDFQNIFEEYQGKKLRLTIEVLPDEIESKDDSVKIQIKLRTIVRHSTSLCNALGLNPYCINEGADGDDYISVPINIAKEYGLV